MAARPFLVQWPPPGWNLWIEDTAQRDRQIRTARSVIAGGGAVFLGSLLPFLTSSQTDLYPVNSNPKETASFFGVVLAALGLAMLAKAKRARLISVILAFIVTGLTMLTLVSFIISGIVGADEEGVMGSADVNLSPQVGIFISMLGCVAAGIGGIMSSLITEKRASSHRERAPRRIRHSSPPGSPMTSGGPLAESRP